MVYETPGLFNAEIFIEEIRQVPWKGNCHKTTIIVTIRNTAIFKQAKIHEVKTGILKPLVVT